MGKWTDTADHALRAYLRAVVFAEPVQMALLEKYGIRLVDFRALRVLRDLGPVPIGRLAEELDTPRSTATGLIDRLESRGLLRREACPGDRRAIIVSVTELGREALEDREVFRDSLPGRSIAALPEEDQVRLAELLERMMGEAARPTASQATS